MTHDDVLDLIGIHVEPGDDDHVLLAIDDAHIAIVLEDRDITGAQEAIGSEAVFRRLLTLPIPLHHLRPLHAQLARLPHRDQRAFIVIQTHLGGGHRPTDGAELNSIQRIERHDRRGLGHAVALGDITASDPLPLFCCLARQRHAS